MRKTKKAYEEYLNNLYSRGETLELTEHCWYGNDKTPREKTSARYLASQALYGTCLRKHDPIAFQVGFQDWKISK